MSTSPTHPNPMLAIGGLAGPTESMLKRPDLGMLDVLNSYRTFAVQPLDDFGLRLPAELGNLLKGHKMVLWSGEESLIPSGHVAEQFIGATYGKVDHALFTELAKDPNVVFGIPILVCEDAEGQVLKEIRIEPRVYHNDCPAEVPLVTMVLVPELAVIRWPRCFSHKDNPAMVMKHAHPERGALERRLFLQAREALETSEALAAFDTLFRHMSLNEELFRLDAVMQNLPFTLEEHPRMEHYRTLLEKQIGHLRGGAGDWYKDGSPASGITLGVYVKGVAPNPALLPLRLRWLIEECRKLGHKHVAEYGSIEGVSLFHLLAQAPDIDWHGFEVSERIVKIGHALAQEGKIKNFNLHVMGVQSSLDFDNTFDAVALFEALEHNSEADGAALLEKAEALVRVGGSVFITTPWGNWSGWDDHTRDIELRKDHVNAYSPKRMQKFLEKHARAERGTIKAWGVENPTLFENNRWVWAQYVLG